MTSEQLGLAIGVKDKQLCNNIIFAYRNKDIVSYRPVTLSCSTNTLVMADLHIPYHDVDSINNILDFAQDKNIDTIVLLGDILDCYQLSTFTKDPSKPNMMQQITIGKQFLQKLRKMFPNARIIYKQGNHQFRIKRTLWENNAKLYELMNQYMILNLLGLEQLNIEYLIQPFRIGKLWYLHGHQYNGGRSQAQHIPEMFMKVVHDNFIVAHYHRVQTKDFKKIDGQIISGYAIGHLAMPMDYSMINKWAKSFSIISYSEDGSFVHKSYSIKQNFIEQSDQAISI